MFVKKRSIVNLKELFNPTYRFSFSIDNEKYLMDIETIMTVKLDSNTFLDTHIDHLTFDESLTKFKVIINKIMDNGFVAFEDSKEFTNYYEMLEYVRSYKRLKQ